MFKLSYSDEESREPKKWESTISSTSTRSNQDPPVPESANHCKKST
jgi:hypothetical protein